jgi:hypothetical protein
MENKFLKSISYSLAFREQDRKHVIENALKNHEKEKIVDELLKYGKKNEIALDDAIKFIGLLNETQITMYCTFKRMHGFYSGARSQQTCISALKKENEILKLKLTTETNKVNLLENEIKTLKENEHISKKFKISTRYKI